MKKKGFTLIELLAVIVILAIIALIAIPVVLNMIDKARKSASLDSAYGYVDAINYNNGLSEVNDNYTKLEDGTYKVSQILNLKMKGQKPSWGTVIVEHGSVKRAELCINKFYVIYENKTVKIDGGCKEEPDETKPVISVGQITTTTKSIEIEFTAGDPQSGIKRTTCKATKGNETYNGSIHNNKCTITNLEKNQEYTYEIEAENNQELKETVSDTVVTRNFQSIALTANPVRTEWASSRTITLSGGIDGSGIQYYIGDELDQSGWINYTEPIVLTSNTNIYMRVYDGYNEQGGETYIEGKIDTTAPELVLGTIDSTTNSITLPITTNEDNESDIKSTTCKVTHNNTTKVGTIINNVCTINNLAKGTEYNYEVESTNNANLKTTRTGTYSTKGFTGISVSSSPAKSEWTSSRTVTLSGGGNGARIQYYIGDELDTSNWHDYSEPLTLTSNTNIYMRLYDGYNEQGGETYIEGKIDTTDPELVLGTVSSTTNSITINITTKRDNESDIKSTTCKATHNNIVKTGTIDGNVCTINNLTKGTEYTYEVTTTNNANLSTTRTGTEETEGFPELTALYSPAKNEWTSKRIITLSGGGNGVRIQYYIGNTLDPSDWHDYTEPIELTQNTSVYMRLYDGHNAQDGQTFTEGLIDTTPPTAASVTKKSATSDSITVTASGTDDSGIARYQFSNDDGDTWSLIQSSNEYTFSGLTSGTYKIKTKVYNGTYVNGGDNSSNYLISDANNIATETIPEPTISISPEGYARSKTVTITYPTGYTNKYSLDGSTWYTYTEPIDFNSNGTISAKAVDGTGNERVVSNQAVTGIDTDDPTCSLTVTSSGVSFDTKTDSTSPITYGMNKTGTAEYNSTDSLPLGTGTFYGYVKDSAGNIGSCSATLSATTPEYTKTTKTCTSSTTYAWGTNTTSTIGTSCPSKQECNSSGYKVYSCSIAGTEYMETTETSSSGYCHNFNKTGCTVGTENRVCYNSKQYFKDGSPCTAKKIYKCRYKYTTTRKECVKNTTYPWGTATNTTVNDCTNNLISCDADHVNQTYVSCSTPTYTCGTGTTKLDNSYCYKIN